MRGIELANEEFYHIYNRGVDKRNVFTCRNDYERFLISMDLLNDKKDSLMKIWNNTRRKKYNISVDDVPELQEIKREPLVEFATYCLNPNHFHFELKQLAENGIQTYMHKVSTSYTNYFNLKYDRSGSLFQGRYKAVHINTNDYFLYLSAYINKNHFIHGYKEGDGWTYSSLFDYLGKRDNPLFGLNTKPILDQFDSREEYETYMRVNAFQFRENKELGKYNLE